MLRSRFATLVAASLALGGSGAVAADLGSVRSMRPVADSSGAYIVTFTANGQFIPRFPGSDRLTGIVYPSFNIRRVEEPVRYAAPDDGFSISVLDDNPYVRFGPVVRVQSGRYLSDDRRLFGLRKINWSVEPGLFVEYLPVSFLRARGELRYGTNGGDGLVGNIGVDFIAPVNRFLFSLGPRLNFADAVYMRRYFGVRPIEALRSGGRFAAYQPGAGIVSAGVLGAVTYQWTDAWATTGYVGYNRLIDQASGSPIPRRIGSLDQLTFGASVSYSFAWSPSRGALVPF